MVRLLFVTFMFSALMTVAATQPTIQCQADKTTVNGKKKPVPVTVLKGPEAKKPVEIQFEGQAFSATWHQRDEFEKQTYLRMKFGDFESSMYDVDPKSHKGPINILSQGDLRFQ